MTDDKRSNRSTRDNLKQALGTLDQVAERLSIPDSTVGTATRLYRELLQVSSEDRMYGWSIEDAVVACLYIACKIDRVPRNADEFVQASGTSEKSLMRRSKRIRSDLDLDIEAFLDPTHYIERYCNKLDLDEDIGRRAKQVLKYAAEAGISGGKSPQGQAAAAIYIATRERASSVTQSDISSVADVSEVTIRNRYQEQAEVLREREEPPEKPAEIVEWFVELTESDTAITERAQSMLENARSLGMPIDEKPLRWSLGAVQLASEHIDQPVHKKTMKSVSGLTSQEIQEARNKLRRR